MTSPRDRFRPPDAARTQPGGSIPYGNGAPWSEAAPSQPGAERLAMPTPTWPNENGSLPARTASGQRPPTWDDPEATAPVRSVTSDTEATAILPSVASDTQMTVILPSVASATDARPARRGGARPAPRNRRKRVVTRMFLVVALFAVLFVTVYGVITAMNGYAQYSRARTSVEAGMTHVRAVQALLTPLMKHPAIPDSATLARVTTELTAAQADFRSARAELTSGVLARVSSLPNINGTVHSAVALLTAADDLCQAGLDLISGAGPVFAVAQGGFFVSPNPSSKPSAPELTQAMIDTLTADFESAVARVNAAVTTVQTVDLSSLPSQFVSAKQIAEIHTAVAAWSGAQPRLATVDAWLHIAPALLGMGKPMQLLVELMDRAEMRSTGGFIGAYGVMTVSKAKIQPFTLADVFALDVPYLNRTGYAPPPAAYSWWPFHGYGLRDSNLSPDFPTSARMGIAMLAKEGGPSVQGAVALNATMIERVLKITGPIVVPGYNVTVTYKNLEPMIRLYTETSAQRDGNDLPVGYQLTSIHERFTALLGQQLMAKTRSLHGSENGALVQALLTSLGTKDVEVYLSDPKAEALLAQLGYDGALAGGANDAVTVVDSNVTGNKASALTTVTYTDAVTLDAKGGATHHLTITYRFSSATDPGLIHFLYKRDYYLTYLRVYTPPGAHLVSYSGFNGGETQINHSDFPGRQMWGGLVDIQDGVPYSLSFVWTEPAVATSNGHGQMSYTLVYQRQSGSNQRLILTITKPGAHSPSVSYNGVLEKDQSFTLTY